MIEAEAARTGEDKLACRLATMSRHTSLTALEAAILLVRDSEPADAARRIGTMARHISGGARQLAASIEASHRAEFVFADAS